MDALATGKLVVATGKTLKRFQLADQKIAAFLYASSTAGRSVLFASALRANGRIGCERVTMLAACEGFSPIDLRIQLLPWLQREGLCLLESSEDSQWSVESVELGYDSILK